MNIDIGKVWNISARVAFAICIACLLFLFTPAAILPFDITEYRNIYGIWIFLSLVLSGALIVSYVMKWSFDFLKKKIKIYNTKKAQKYILSTLSNEEKAFLKKYYDKGQTAIIYSLMNPVAKKLETFQIISMAAGTSLAPRGLTPGFIQPWVFELVRKNPNLLGEDETNSVEENKDV